MEDRGVFADKTVIYFICVKCGGKVELIFCTLFRYQKFSLTTYKVQVGCMQSINGSK